MIVMLLGALIIGLTVGMLGSGGSVISVPILVYLVGHGTKESITESLAIVGLIAFFAAIPYARAKQIDWWSFLYFGVPGMLGTLWGAWLGGQASETLQLLVFGGVLLLAAVIFLVNPLPSSSKQPEELRTASIGLIGGEGLLVGIVTGFVGVGGGFLIVPALVVMGKLPIRMAIGTSLAIIVIKSLVGFIKYEHYLLTHDLSLDLNTIWIFSVVGITGSLLGSWINARLNPRRLKQIFAGFLILLGGFVIFYEGQKILNHPAATENQISPAQEVS